MPWSSTNAVLPTFLRNRDARRGGRAELRHIRRPEGETRGWHAGYRVTGSLCRQRCLSAPLATTSRIGSKELGTAHNNPGKNNLVERGYAVRIGEGGVDQNIDDSNDWTWIWQNALHMPMHGESCRPGGRL